MQCYTEYGHRTLWFDIYLTRMSRAEKSVRLFWFQKDIDNDSHNVSNHIVFH